LMCRADLLGPPMSPGLKGPAYALEPRAYGRLKATNSAG
jgi:hypothetical protein